MPEQEQTTDPPHPLESVPQFPLTQGFTAEQPQEFAPTPPPPQVFGATQVFAHCTVWPQLPTAGPHALFLHASTSFSTHEQVAGDPTHDSLAAQAAQRAGSAQPLLASVGTQLLPHLLVPAPQLPITHCPPEQMRVPEPGAGQLDGSQPVAVQP